MFLAACATEFEMQPLLDLLSPEKSGYLRLVTGVGIVETTLSLTRFLEKHQGQVKGVLNFGVGGAYVSAKADDAALLDICLAESEVFGDCGICYKDHLEPLGEELLQMQDFSLDQGLLERAERVLSEQGVSCRHGNFVTVCGVSATAERGNILCGKHSAICENMEGAAMARVCAEFHLPLLEIRAISNFVEDRDLSRWKLVEACQCAGKTAALLLKDFLGS